MKEKRGLKVALFLVMYEINPSFMLLRVQVFFGVEHVSSSIYQVKISTY